MAGLLAGPGRVFKDGVKTMRALIIRRTLLAAVVTAFVTGFLSVPAMAGHCPKDVKKIDAALKTSKFNKMQMSEAMGLRAKGDDQHTNGQHGDSLNSLRKAMKILGISN